MENNSLKNTLLIPVSIIIAGLAIGGALIFIKARGNANPAAAGVAVIHAEDNTPAITAQDHILGNPNAPVVLVEYADTDCPYCQAFLPTLHKIINQYGPSGQVAWVYRHFAFHPNAPKEAEALECINEIGGNDKFWQYLDLLFSKKDFSQSPYVGIDRAQLPSLASTIGVDQTMFSTCLNSGKYKSKIDSEYNDAVKAGAQGTPYTVIVTRTGKIPITSGAISYDTLNNAIKALLNQTPQ